METLKCYMRVLLITSITLLIASCGDENDDLNKGNPNEVAIDPVTNLNCQPLVQWGATKERVKQYQTEGFYIAGEDYETLIYSSSAPEGNIVISYLFDEDSLLCAASIVMDVKDNTTELVNQMLKDYSYFKKQDGQDIYLNSDLTTAVILNKSAGFYTIGWSIVDQTIPGETEDTYTGTIEGHDYVDLGLSVKWSTCNIGAYSPEGYGGYYSWGETTTHTTYWWSDYSFWTDKNGDGYFWSDELKSIGKDIKNTSYDAAHVLWKGTWRMPTKDEMLELFNNCTIIQDTKNGVNGFTLTGTNGQSIFMPSAGYKSQSKDYYIGESGYYRTSTVYIYGDEAYCGELLQGRNKVSSTVDGYARNYGMAIRPVSE